MGTLTDLNLCYVFFKAILFYFNMNCYNSFVASERAEGICAQQITPVFVICQEQKEKLRNIILYL